MKRCTKCRVEKPLADFYINQANRDRRSSWCKLCANAYTSQRSRETYDPQSARARSLRNNYRLTVENYNVMWYAQGGTCAICRQPETANARGGGTKWLAVDHDHACCPGSKSCGRCIRGLLCNQCNAGLGYFLDEAYRLASAIQYLAVPA